jgi:hypothetical protein
VDLPDAAGPSSAMIEIFFVMYYPDNQQGFLKIILYRTYAE